MNDVCERLSKEAIQRNFDGDLETRNFLREVRTDIQSRGSGLFVIEQLRTDTDRAFWECSTEHGCGWSLQKPKQAFSKSQLAREIASMIDRGTFCTVVIRELSL